MKGMTEESKWVPPHNIEEILKKYFLPSSLHINRIFKREIKKGEREIQLLPFLCHAQKASLDIGANKGVYSYAMMKHSSEVHAFEPNPKMFDVLSSWGKGKIFLYPFALGDKTEAGNLRVPRNKKGFSNQGASLKPRSFDADHGIVSVEVKRLDEVGIDNIGFIKIDVEGFESQVLEGAKETLRRFRPNLLVEVEEVHNNLPLTEMIEKICNGYGYDCFVLRQGQLAAFHNIDPSLHFKNRSDRKNYIFNFIFLPR